jgi:hypothetical protein
LTAEYNILPENGAFFDSGLIYRRCVIADYNGVVFEVIPVSIGQFTCLIDANGTKIYEGDIIESEAGCRHQVLFDEECVAFCQYGTEKDYTGEYPSLGYLSKEYIDKYGKRIIGNIHDNHGLIDRSLLSKTSNQIIIQYDL